MLSPHAILRQRSLFVLSLDADRARRAAGLPELEHVPLEGKRLVTGDNLVRRLAPGIWAAVQRAVFNGG